MVVLVLSCFGAATAAGSPATVAMYWQPPGASPGDAARAAFAHSMEQRGARLVSPPAVSTGAQAPSPAARLEAAIAEYRAFHYAAALDALGALAQSTEAAGGGDLDARQLASLHLHRGLARLELAQTEAAWDDFVRAAQLDPGHVLDPAQYPPRVVATWRRAAADLAELPRAQLEVAVPEGAVVRVDGRIAAGSITVTLGAHLVHVDADGFEPWGGLYTATAAREKLVPPLRPRQPPDGDHLAAAARAAGARRIVLGTVMRDVTGWRFVARRLDPEGGASAAEEAPLDDSSAERVVQRVLARLLDGPTASPGVDRRPATSRWWIWTVAAAALTTAMAVAIPIGILYGTPATGTAGGALGTLR